MEPLVKTISPSDREWAVERARRLFRETFGDAPGAIAAAPGRVNIIGEHTDYCGGLVLPAAIPLYTVVAARRRDASPRPRFPLPARGEVVAEGDRRGQSCGDTPPKTYPTTRITSADFGSVEIPATIEKQTGGFADYVAGAIEECGLSGTPLDVVISSDLPAQAGLSSSASLLVATIACLDKLAGRERSPVDTALAAKKVENYFVGVPCGFMDQFAVACSKAGEAQLLDCEDFSSRGVPTKLGGCAWLVVCSGQKRELKAGGYRDRVSGLKAAVQKLVDTGAEPTYFGRCFPAGLTAELAANAEMPEEELELVEHFCSENARVLAMRHALERGNAGEAAVLLGIGHRSLADLFKVSTPEIERIWAMAQEIPGFLGMRLTGAGMGGSLVAIVDEMQRAAAAEELIGRMKKEIGLIGQAYLVSEFSGGVEAWAE